MVSALCLDIKMIHVLVLERRRQEMRDVIAMTTKHSLMSLAQGTRTWSTGIDEGKLDVFKSDILRERRVLKYPDPTL